MGADSFVGATKIDPEGETVLGPGSILGGKYEVLRVLGAGGMGIVLEARHLELRQTVAIKVMHPDVAREADSVKRFMREGRAAALLRSDHAVRIHDVGRLASGIPFLVMEHLVGEDLDHLRSRRKLEVLEVVDYVLQAISAIAEAHDSGLVHRDIKPQNLFLATLPDGSTRVKVLDFGLAKELATVSSTSAALTTENMILGSPHFMSPEQIRSPGEVDARADIWALGASMVQLLTGQPPYSANNVHGLLARILSDPPPKVRERRADIPVALEKIIERCMAKNLDRRYGSVIELATALQLAVGWAPSGASRGRGSRNDPPASELPPSELPPSEPPPSARRSDSESMQSTLIGPAIPRSAEPVQPVTLHFLGPAVLSAPVTPPFARTLPLPAPAHLSAPAPVGAPAPVASPASLAPHGPVSERPRRVPRAWLAAFFLITVSATIVAGFVVRERSRRAHARQDPVPTIVGVPEPASSTAAPVASLIVPAVASVVPVAVAVPSSTAPIASAPPQLSPTGSKRPKTPSTTPSAGTQAPPPLPSTAPCVGPYCW